MIHTFLCLLREPLEVMRVAQAKFPPPAVDRLQLPPPSITRNELANRALVVALAEEGKGETTGNNRGPDICRYCAPHPDGHEWCAAFWGFCYAQAALGFGIALPFERSLGAKALGRNVAAAGRRFLDPAEALPGDLMILNRGPSGSWQGHAVMVQKPARGTIITGVEGNHGPRVRAGVERDIRDPRTRFACFCSIRQASPLLGA